MSDAVRAPRRRRLARGAIGTGVVLLAWEAVSRAGIVDATYLPPASSVLAVTGGLLLDPEFLANIAGTLASWALGLAVAAAVAIPLGVLFGSSRRTELAGTAAIELLRPIPSVALIPLAILLLGRGLDMRVALVAYAAAWPILLNTIYGIRETDPIARDTARAFGFGRAAVLWRVALPSAAPFVYTGLRVSAGVALILAVSTELIAGGGPGIGTWMLANSQAGVPRELLYAGIGVSGALGVAINAIMVAGERRLFGWDVRVRSMPA